MPSAYVAGITAPTSARMRSTPICADAVSPTLRRAKSGATPDVALSVAVVGGDHRGSGNEVCGIEVFDPAHQVPIVAVPQLHADVQQRRRFRFSQRSTRVAEFFFHRRGSG